MLNTELLRDAELSFLGIYLEALFTIAKKGKQLKYSVNEWTDRMWYTHAMEYYSSLKRN